MAQVSVALGDIAAWLTAEAGAEFIGDPAISVDGLAPLEAASPTSVSFLANPKYIPQLASSKAACVIVGPAARDAAVARGAALIAPDPYHAYALLSQWWARMIRPSPVAGVHPSAVVDPTAWVDGAATVAPLAVIEAGARVEAGAFIGPYCLVGARARIGAGTRLVSHVHFGHGCSIGQRGLLHPGVVIGADGFGFAPHQGRYEKIEQLGNVRMGDDVELGANTCIDRGAMADTVLEDGVKLDNLVQVAHNVRLGKHVAMAGCSAIAGSSTIGDHSTVAGAGMVAGHLTIGAHVHVSAATLVTRSISQPGVYTGVYPFEDNAAWEKNAATLRRLHSLRDRIRELEKKKAP